MQRTNSPKNVVNSDAAATWSSGTSELWHHRELLQFLVWRDIKVKYKQTVLGVFWVILQPLGIVLVLSLFLGRLIKVQSGGVPYPVFAYSGMLIWQFFANSVTESSNSLIANERLITKVYFPRIIIPLAAVLASLLDFAVGLLPLVFLLAYYRVEPTVAIIFLPVIVLLAVITSLGVGLWLCALNVKYRDVRYTLGFLIQFLFLATPVAYPSNIVSGRWRVWYELNPMVGVVDAFRWCTYGSPVPPLRYLGISIVVGILIFVSGVFYFRRTEDSFADFI